MSIQLTISLIFSGELSAQLSINSQLFELGTTITEGIVSHQIIYEWDEEAFEITLGISGKKGSSATLLVNHPERGSYIQTIEILNKDTAERTFKIKPRSFHRIINQAELEMSDFWVNSSKQIPIDGMEEKGIVKTQQAVNAEIEVCYATDRNKIKGKGNYGNQRAELHYGTCTVNIPKRKKLGEIPRPEWWKFEFKENEDKHVMIIKLEEQDSSIFFDYITKNSIDEENAAFVFIHGYNTSFNDAVYRTAQMAYDLGFKGIPITYSWPSADTVLNYPYDEESVQYTTGSIVGFLKDLYEKTALKKIHLIAHSMGNRALSNAIMSLHSEGFFTDKKFDQIILAAPDIDAQVFLKEIAAKIIPSTKRITLYASSGDRALQTSRKIHSSMLRLGESGELITCLEGLDTIDASKTDTSFLGHGYFSSTAPLINDIFQLINFNLEPSERNLLKIAEYWSFK